MQWGPSNQIWFWSSYYEINYTLIKLDQVSYQSSCKCKLVASFNLTAILTCISSNVLFKYEVDTILRLGS